MVEGFEAGADAALAASIFHFGEYSIDAVRDAAERGGRPDAPAELPRSAP